MLYNKELILELLNNNCYKKLIDSLYNYTH